MTPAAAIAGGALTAALLMMLAELQLSRHNERVLRSRGAIEPPDDVIGVMTWTYPAAFVAMALEGAFAGRAPGTITLAGAVLFGAAKALKFWAVSSLGVRWTFKVLVLRDAPLVTSGPYAYVRHPNYLAVVGELAGMALLLGAAITGPVAVGGFLYLLHRRIEVEERALGVRQPRP